MQRFEVVICPEGRGNDSFGNLARVGLVTEFPLAKAPAAVRTPEVTRPRAFCAAGQRDLARFLKYRVGLEVRVRRICDALYYQRRTQAVLDVYVLIGEAPLLDTGLHLRSLAPISVESLGAQMPRESPSGIV